MNGWKEPIIVLAASILAACGNPTQTSSPNTPVSEAEVHEAPRPEREGAVIASVEDRLREMFVDFRDSGVYYFSGIADLNGDGRDEVIVHVVSPMLCGSGGCNTLVFTPGETGYKQVAEITVTRPPIRVSSRETNGWRNLIVHVSGGGIEAHEAELRFDRDSYAYPSNPSVPPAEPAPDLEGAEVVIPEFETLTDGRELFTE